MRMQIETASQPRLICILHDQCALQLRHVLSGELKDHRTLLDKSQNILVLLQRSLKQTDATSRSLFHLYDYCYCMLEKDDPDAIEKTLGIINTLRLTFKQLRKRPG
jgi:flagellin-specific chaperone FliS